MSDSTFILLKWDVDKTSGKVPHVSNLSAIEMEQVKQFKQVEDKQVQDKQRTILDMEKEGGSIVFCVKTIDVKHMDHNQQIIHFASKDVTSLSLVVATCDVFVYLYVCETKQHAIEVLGDLFYDEHHDECEECQPCPAVREITKCKCYPKVESDFIHRSETRFSGRQGEGGICVKMFHVGLPYLCE
jgi:hypothetical protein